MKIIVAGAGIGGLTAALCLAKSGHHVRVLEQSDTFAPVGAGLQCGANALKVLEYLGLLDKLAPLSVSPERAEFRDFATGQLLSQLTLGSQYAKRYGAPYWHIHRADLQAVLLNELNQNAPGAICMSSAVTDFTQTDESVRVSVSNGQQFEADCLVGADGIRSVIRSKLLNGQTARFSGHTAWRAVVPVKELPNDWMPTVVTNFVGPKKHAILYYVKGGQTANLVGVIEKDAAGSDSWVNKAPWQELQKDFSGWHTMVQDIIGVVDPDHCYRWALYDHPPVKQWSTHRVTLLGDAAHASLPFMASGAAMAIEDARILDRAMGQITNVPEALRCYQNTRGPRTRYVQETSARMGRLYHLSNPTLRRIAFAGFAIAMHTKQSFLPSYDANNVRLASY